MQGRHLVETRGLTRRFGATVALEGIDWRVPEGSAVGLVGRNGSGKTTLLQTALGLLLPSQGSCRTLGVDVAALGEEELARIGYVDQEAGLLEWLSVEQHLRYVAAFQPRWDAELEGRVVELLELGRERKKRVSELSAGMRQRLAVALAVCHRPQLLLLDEPVSALDPIARESTLRLFVERVIEDGAALVVSSHVLHDVEKIVDRVSFLDAGHLVEDAPLDELKERYAEWIVTSPGPELPASFSEPYVLARSGNGRRARLWVRAGESELAAFRARHGVEVERQSLDLERIFPLIAEGGRR